MRYLFFTFVLLFATACKSDVVVNLAEVEIGQGVDDALDLSLYDVAARTDTLTGIGTLNIRVTPLAGFNIAGVPLPEHKRGDGPNLELHFYSDEVIAELAKRIEENTRGAFSRGFPLPEGATLGARIRAQGADDTVIGLTVWYSGPEPFFDDIEVALSGALGPATHADDGSFWYADGRYLVSAPYRQNFSIFAESQVYQGCLLAAGVFWDIDNCDRAAFEEAFPASIRTRP